MDYFGLQEEIVLLKNQLVQARGVARAGLQVQLAWAVRRHATRRALRLARLAEARAAGAETEAVRARAFLVRGEAAWLFGELDAAAAFLIQARNSFERLSDRVGQGDCLMLKAVLHQEQGENALRNAAYAEAHDTYRRAADVTRLRLAQVRIATCEAYDNPVNWRSNWSETLIAWDGDDAHPALRAAIQAAWGAITFQREAGVAIRHHQRAYEHATAARDIATACVQAVNAGALATNIKAMDLAIEWAERGVQDALPTGWPRITAWCKVQMAVVLSGLNRHELAAAMLREAQQALRQYPNRIYAHACWYLGDVYLSMADGERAFPMHQETERVGRHLGNLDLVSHGLRGQSAALAFLRRVPEAVETAQRGLEFARERSGPWHEVMVLQALGSLAAEHKLPLPEGADAPSAPVHYFEQALKVAAGIDGYGVEPELYVGLSRGYEAAGDLARALAFERRAAEARQAAASRHAADIAIGMQIRYETEQVKSEAEHHRSLATVQAQRAEAMEAARDTLQHLAAIGQKIAAQLTEEAVFDAMNQHVGDLMDAPAVLLFLLQGDELVPRFSRQELVDLAELRVPLDSADSQAARCLRERQLLSLEWSAPDVDPPGLIPGTRPMASAMFVPLAIGDALLGVLSIQSERDHAYGEREQQIVTMVAAYGSVALANVRHARRLAEAEAEAASLRALHLERANQALVIEKERLSRESLQDPLTGLFNRRRLDLALSEQGDSYSVALVDIDFFKRVNDTFSHQMGDEVLKAVAVLLRQACRQDDLAVRYGGEEFALLLPHARAAEARHACERLRAAVQNHDWKRLHPDLSVTVSIGVADNQEADGTEAIFAMADKRLYAAKRGGRNRVVAAEHKDETVVMG